MRSHFYAVALAVAVWHGVPAKAVVTLEFWSGVQDFTPYNSPAPSPFDPNTINGLRNWDFAGQNKLTALSVPANSQFILKIVARDHDNVGNGSGYTWSGPSNAPNGNGLFVFAVSFGFAPGVLWGTRDANTTGLGGQYDFNANTVTVWEGIDSAGDSTSKNMNFAILHYDSSHFTMGNLFFDAANKKGITPFQQANGDVLYPLANLVLTAGPISQSGQLTLTKPTTPGPTFGSLDGSNVIDYDTAVWGQFGIPVNPPTLAFTVTPVPEPTSLVLVGLLIPAANYRRRWLTRSKCA